MTLAQFLAKRRYLVWYVKDITKISPAAAVEAVLNYGDFSDVKQIIKILGITKTAKIFKRESNRQRNNYRPEIKNYFTLYFKKYAR